MSKGTPEEKKLAFAIAYNQCINTLVKDMDTHREAVVKVLAKDEYKGDAEEFAEDAFLYNLNKFYQHHKTLNELVKEAKGIINNDL